MKSAISLCCVGLLGFLAIAISLNIDVQNMEHVTTLVVNCSSNPRDEKEFNLTKLSSLILSHSYTGNLSDFREVASIQSITLHPIDIFYENATAEGAFYTDRTSFLSLTWENPSDNAWGTYKCVANGIDGIGHPVSVSNTRHFTRGNLEIMLDEIRSLKSELKTLKHDVNSYGQWCWSEIGRIKREIQKCDEKMELFVNAFILRLQTEGHMSKGPLDVNNITTTIPFLPTEGHLSKVPLDVNNVTTTIQFLQTKGPLDVNNITTSLPFLQTEGHMSKGPLDVNNVTNSLPLLQTEGSIPKWPLDLDDSNISNQRKELLLHILFETPASLNGHTYYLSRQEPSVVSTVAMETCQTVGGHLVDIDDRTEFAFVMDLVKPHMDLKFVLIGGLNESQTGQWVTTFNFGSSGEPDEKGNDFCLAVSVDCGCVMADVPCSLGDKESLPARFLCEIP